MLSLVKLQRAAHARLLLDDLMLLLATLQFLHLPTFPRLASTSLWIDKEASRRFKKRVKS